MTDITDKQAVQAILQAIRAELGLTQGALAERLGVAFATVNRWEGGLTMPQRASREAIVALAAEAGVDAVHAASDKDASAARETRRRSRRGQAAAQSTKSMEQMLWDAACSIRGERDAAKFKDYLLPLLFLKRLSDVFDDEIERLAEDFGDRQSRRRSRRATTTCCASTSRGRLGGVWSTAEIRMSGPSTIRAGAPDPGTSAST